MKSFRSKVLGKKYKDLLNSNDGTVPPGRTSNAGTTASEHDANIASSVDDVETPEETAERLVKTFCMSEVDGSGAEVALLPSLVEVAESSPAAAAESARYIRKFLYRENWSRPTVVYNAVMLMRILVENPGYTFTRNMDKKFVETVREVLRNCQNLQTVQFLIDALQSFEAKGAVDEGLGRMVEMWQKEKTKSKIPYPSEPNGQPQFTHPLQPYSAGHMSRRSQNEWPAYDGGGVGDRSGRGGGSHRSHTLPRPQEIRKRLEEARTTAGVLADVVNTSSPAALLDHDLAGDLSSRCRRATAQILEYLDAQNPIPDNTEMAHLLVVHEAVQQSLHHYYRAVLEARKQLGVGETRRSETRNAPTIEMTPAGMGKGKGTAPQSPGVVPGGNGLGGPGGNGNGNGYSYGDGYAYGVDQRQRGNTNGSNVRGTAFSALPDRDNPAVDDLYSDSGSDSDSRMAAAIAASTAPGANSRPSYRYLGTDDPFSNAPVAESSRSSSRVRPGAGGGASSAAAAAAATDYGSGGSAYGALGTHTADQDGRSGDSGKARQTDGGFGRAPSAYGPDGFSPIEAENYPPASGIRNSGGVGASSSAAIDSAAHAGGPVYRY